MTSHHWSLDGLEEDVARVEEDGQRVITVPRWLIPPDAKEGQILSVDRVLGVGTSTVTITIDQAATAAALAKSAATVEKISKASMKRDAGGDVAL